MADIQTGPFGSQLHKEDYVENGTPIVTVEHLGERRFAMQNLPYVSDEDCIRLDKYRMLEGDVVFSRVGSVDRCSYAFAENNGWLFSGRCIRVRACREIDPLYLYYYLNSEAIKRFVRSIAVGATMPSINTKLMGEIPLLYPSIKEQRNMVHILSVIDDKIERNIAINKNLEEQAQAIFTHLFDNCSFHVGELSQIAHIIMGQSPNGASYNTDKNGIVFFQGRAEFGFRYPTPRLYTTAPKRMAQTGDILMSVRAPVGDLNIAFESCCIGRGISAIRSIDEHPSFLFYSLLSLKDQFDVFNGEGTVFGSINSNALKSMAIRIPPQEITDRFEEIVAPMDSAVRKNTEEIIFLTSLRDTLLPRLMSGEIDVSDIAL